MNKLFKTILIFSIAVFSVGVLFVLPVNAQVDELVVEYWSEAEGKWIKWLPGSASFPVFSETNFLPGNDVSRLVRVTNNSGELQRIATEAINESDPNNFATQLNLTIKENATDIFNDTLQKFFDQGETYLSSLASGAQTQYNFTIAFNSGAGNYYQEKALGFDILVGFKGTEGGLPLPPPGGGDGGGLPPGLTINSEKASYIGTTTATITWTTSYFSTSQVIYDTVPGKFNLATSTGGGPSNYGYAYSKEGDDSGLEKVTFHSVTISGLIPDTTYYYRAVSHGSFAISTQHSFTTKGVAGAETEKEESGEGEEGIPGEGPVVWTGPGETGIPPAGEGVEPEVEGESIEEEKEGIVEETTIEKDKDLDKFLATAGACMAAGNLCWLFFAVIIILTVLYLLSRNKKEKEIKKKDLIFLLIIILLIILYCIFCCSYCWILILVISLLFILFTVLILRRKIRERES